MAPVAGVQLTAAQLAVRQRGAAKVVAGVSPASALPLAFAALDIVLIVLLPWLFWRKGRSAGDIDEPTTEQGA